MGFAVPKPEERWHRQMLVLILVVATCARFYGLDTSSLSTNELYNVGACAIPGWLEMSLAYSAHSGMPPLYPSLLCSAVSITNNSEFVLRGLSAVAGVGSIFFIYITGRDFISPVTGLLAAAVLATNFQQGILFSRDASVYALLLLLFLAHNYCFCKLYLSSKQPAATPLVLRQVTANSRLEWTWTPAFPGSGGLILAFWISGTLLFYTCPVSLILFLCELVAPAILLSGQQTTLPRFSKTLWGPLLLTALPWLLVYWGYRYWILDGNLVAITTITTLGQKLSLLLPTNHAIQASLLALVILAAATLAYIVSTRKPWPRTFVTYALAQMTIALPSLWFIKVNEYYSHIYFWWIWILLLLAPLAAILERIPLARARTACIIACILLILYAQSGLNALNKVYRRGGGADFRLVATIMHADQDFMNSARPVIMSSELFKYYLDREDIISSNYFALDKDTTELPAEASFRNTDFYYLEYQPNDKNQTPVSTAWSTLTNRFRMLCNTNLPKIRIAKFSRSGTPAESATADCRNFLSSELPRQ